MFMWCGNMLRRFWAMCLDQIIFVYKCEHICVYLGTKRSKIIKKKSVNKWNENVCFNIHSSLLETIMSYFDIL